MYYMRPSVRVRPHRRRESSTPFLPVRPCLCPNRGTCHGCKKDARHSPLAARRSMISCAARSATHAPAGAHVRLIDRQAGQAAMSSAAAGNFDVRESPPGSSTTRSNFAAAPPSLPLALRPPCLCLCLNPLRSAKRTDVPFFSRALVPRPVWVGRVVSRHPCPCRESF
jgi:hypothetical protein